MIPPATAETSYHQHHERTPLHELTRREGVDGLYQRLFDLTKQSKWDEIDKTRVKEAIDKAKEWYQFCRPRSDDQPFVTHPLRVAIRILSIEHLNTSDQDYATTADEVIAAIFHDIVEDDPWMVANIPRDVDRKVAQQCALETLWDDKK